MGWDGMRSRALYTMLLFGAGREDGFEMRREDPEQNADTEQEEMTTRFHDYPLSYRDPFAQSAGEMIT
jgi:hypothetical protein